MLAKTDDPNALLMRAVRDERLGRAHLLLLVELIQHAASHGDRPIAREQIRARLNLGNKTFRNRLYELRRYGYLSAESASANRGYGESHSINCPEVRDRVWRMTNGKCAYCGCDTVRGGPASAERFCIEHIVPRAKGGPDNIANYASSCSACNSKKHDRHVLAFIQSNQIQPLENGARRP